MQVSETLLKDSCIEGIATSVNVTFGSVGCSLYLYDSVLVMPQRWQVKVLLPSVVSVAVVTMTGLPQR